MTPKHLKFLREVAKFLSGIIAGDLLFGLWVLATGYYPFQFLGVFFDMPLVYAWLTADLVLFLFLFHFAWKVPLPLSNPRRTFFFVTGIIFLIVGLAHFSRIVFGVPLVIGTWEFPYWLNGLGVAVTSFLSYTSFHFAMHR